MRWAVSALVLLVAGCAAAPEDVAPLYTSAIPYESWSCDQLAQEKQNLAVAVANESVQQQKAHSGDTVGVLLLGVPTASMSGENVAPQLASLKGQQQAVAEAAAHDGCPAGAATPGT